MIQPDRFCEDVCLMVESWLERVSRDATIQERIDRMPMVRPSYAGVIDLGRFDVGIARSEEPELLVRRPPK